MSQVISIRIPEQHYKEACAAFHKEVDLNDINNLPEKALNVVFDESTHEIICEGLCSDALIAALVKVKDQFDGKMFYEGEEWDEKGSEVVNEAGSIEKMWIFLAIIFFPVTLIYLFLRAVVWAPYKIWKATR